VEGGGAGESGVGVGKGRGEGVGVGFVGGEDAEGDGCGGVGGVCDEAAEPGVAHEATEGVGGGPGGDVFGEGVGVEEDVAAAEGEEIVELVVGDVALVDGFEAAEDGFLVVGGRGGGVSVDEADAGEEGVVFVEAGPVGVAGPDGDGEGDGGGFSADVGVEGEGVEGGGARGEVDEYGADVVEVAERGKDDKEDDECGREAGQEP
jgi:hypothetical protein